MNLGYLRQAAHEIETFLSDHWCMRRRKRIHFHKDNLRHLPRFPDFFVTFRILSSSGNRYSLWAGFQRSYRHEIAVNPILCMDEGWAIIDNQWTVRRCPRSWAQLEGVTRLLLENLLHLYRPGISFPFLPRLASSNISCSFQRKNRSSSLSELACDSFIFWIRRIKVS